jgi:COMPASS component SWD3
MVASLVLGEHKRSVSSVKFSPDGNLLVSASADKSIHVYDTQKQQRVSVLDGEHSQGLNDVVWLEGSTGSMIASASDDRTVKIWDLEREVAVISFSEHRGFVFCLAVQTSTNLLLSGSYDETVKLWDLRSRTSVQSTEAHSEPVTSVDFNPTNCTEFVSSGHDGIARIWDVASFACKRSLCVQSSPPISRALFAPNGRHLLLSTLDHTLRLWDLNDYASPCKKSYTGHTNIKYCLAADFTRHALKKGENREIVCGSERGDIFAWEVNNDKAVRRFEGHSAPVLATACSPVSPTFASGGLDNSVRLWPADAEPVLNT